VQQSQDSLQCTYLDHSVLVSWPSLTSRAGPGGNSEVEANPNNFRSHSTTIFMMYLLPCDANQSRLSSAYVFFWTSRDQNLFSDLRKPSMMEPFALCPYRFCFGHVSSLRLQLYHNPLIMHTISRFSLLEIEYVTSVLRKYNHDLCISSTTFELVWFAG
jgi:hypothetical protein